MPSRQPVRGASRSSCPPPPAAWASPIRPIRPRAWRPARSSWAVCSGNSAATRAWPWPPTTLVPVPSRSLAAFRRTKRHSDTYQRYWGMRPSTAEYGPARTGPRMSDSTNSINFSSSDGYIRAALGGLSARQRAIANNVANVDTPNFKASEVRFEEALKRAMQANRQGTVTDQSALNASVSRGSLIDATSTRGDGNNVDIEREMQML